MTRRRVEAAPEPEHDGFGPIEYGDLLGALGRVCSDRRWSVEGAIEGEPIVVLSGPEKKWKSWIAADLAVSIATGGKWLGAFQARTTGDAVIVDGEYGIDEWTRRAKRICAGRGLDAAEVVPRLRYFDARFGFMLGPKSVEYVQLVADLKAHPPGLLVIDPFRNFLEGDENSAKDVIAAMRLINNLRCVGRCPVLVTHHLGKSGTMSGSRAIRTRADMLIDGSDGEQPWYRAGGRTIRSGDPIASRFTVAVTHEEDGDDLVARTRLSLRFAKDGGERAPTSATAGRLYDELKRRTSPASAHAIGVAAGVTNGSKRAQGLRELADLGLAERSKDGWRLSDRALLSSLPAGRSSSSD